MPTIHLNESVAGHKRFKVVAVATGTQVLPVGTRLSSLNWTPGSWVVSAEVNGVDNATAFATPTEVHATNKPGLWYVVLPDAFFSSGSGATVGDKITVYVDNTGGSEDMEGREIEIEVIEESLPSNSDIAAIKAKTDNLPPDPADASDIAASFTTVNTKLDALDVDITTLISKADELAALLHKNSKLDNTTYNANGFMTAARLRTFVDATACNAAVDGAADNADGEVMRFLITGVEEGVAKVSSYKLTRVL